jgi:hypothetical protein
VSLHLVYSEPPIDRHLDAIMDGIVRRERARRRRERIIVVIVWMTVLVMWATWGPQ